MSIKPENHFNTGAQIQKITFWKSHFFTKFTLSNIKFLVHNFWIKCWFLSQCDSLFCRDVCNFRRTYNRRIPESLRFQGASSGSWGSGPCTGRSLGSKSGSSDSLASSHSTLKMRKRVNLGIRHGLYEMQLRIIMVKILSGVVGTVTFRRSYRGC